MAAADATARTGVQQSEKTTGAPATVAGHRPEMTAEAIGIVIGVWTTTKARAAELVAEAQWAPTLTHATGKEEIGTETFTAGDRMAGDWFSWSKDPS